jgi:CheY-like chemotaxis protein
MPESPVRVLVVDDDDSIRALVARVFQRAGCHVVVAANGPEALRVVRAQSRPFDVCVLDVMMPQMSGVELARWLRQRDPHAKVLYFTGNSDHLFGDRAVLADGEAFVEKPVTVQGLLEAASLLLFGHTHGLDVCATAV